MLNSFAAAINLGVVIVSAIQFFLATGGWPVGFATSIFTFAIFTAAKTVFLIAKLRLLINKSIYFTVM
jgi:hypothetical protein